ncbi:S8 family serine peptidase [Micromonospora polyrhachis]|uniref:Subtilisin family serine protease n=1 Tax=Micromonospora polyrhachis TaxID=1282883 RepID=A0A7W7SX60_9ACTN|nr:S8 family serine peptidase [Micromonospora polyrhachis]MBB4962623.1 subtilisin family serine protease [Micromonospora polyrhachis]
MPRWRRRSLLGVTVAAALVVPGGGAAAHGQPSEPPTGGVVTKAPGSGQTTSRVTLITGDVVTVTSGGNQPTQVTVNGRTGSNGNVTITTEGRDTYVLPREAQSLVISGKLDRRLFNVTGLIEQGYDDARSGSIPLIVRYRAAAVDARRAAPAAPSGAQALRSLTSINGAAMAADKKQAEVFWEAIDDDSPQAGTARTQLAGGIERVWLDGRAEALLDVSVPQIGAPDAWAAGYDGTGVKVAVLDTGVDTSHPDLAGKIVDSRSFVPNEEVKDGHGHGTHVAATIAGTGAASGGRHKGVAPGAQLIVGKVLGDGGSGAQSGIIEGMEWAARSGAKIVSMSLGGPGGDGTDPMSLAVNELTAETGALFTIAAGNDGRQGASTLGSPGTADAALTVGAVDDADDIADFSSRGPRVGDGVVKPEITAPGVGIVAARATGTAMGTVVDEHYTSASGTSMATPHVAGAAAILAQRYPDWPADRLKGHLVSTAKAHASTPAFSQGAGRVDVSRATRQAVSGTGVVSFGIAQWDATTPVVKQVTYTNPGDQPVTLALTLRGTGTELPAGLLSLGADSVTVPAKGTATVPVTMSAADVPTGTYSGHLSGVSADGATVVSTAIGLVKDVKRFKVTVKVVGRDGAPADPASTLVRYVSMDGRGESNFTNPSPDGTLSLTLPADTEYLFQADTVTRSPEYDRVWEYTMGTLPNVVITGDRTITFDARKGAPVTVRTPKPSQTVHARVGFTAHSTDQKYYWALEQWLGGETAVYTIPTAQPNDNFRPYFGWKLTAPDLAARVVGRNKVSLDELAYFGGHVGSLRFDGTKRLPVVSAGTGTAQEYAGLDVRGKTALVRRSANVPFRDQLARAIEAGAAAVIIFNNAPGRWGADLWGDTTPSAVPAMTLSGKQGEKLLDVLRRDRVTIEFTGVAVSPYSYDLVKSPQGGWPANPRYQVRNNELATLRTVYRASAAGTEGGDLRFFWVPGQNTAFGQYTRLPMPATRTEYVTTGLRTTQRVLIGPTWQLGGSELGESIGVLRPGQRLSRTWNKAVSRTALPPALDEAAFRDGDLVVVQAAGLLDTGTDHTQTYVAIQRDKVLATVYRNGERLGTSKLPTFAFPAAPERAQYRVTLDVERADPWWTTSTKVNTAWTFHSQRPDARQLVPMLSVDYDIDVDINNRAKADRRFEIGLNVRHPKGLSGPAIRDTKLWVSYDDGTTWQLADVDRKRAGQFEAIVRHPKLATTNGFVSLRVQATDADGNTVEQTVTRAYQLR